MERLRVLEAQAEESRKDAEEQKQEIDRIRKLADPQIKFAESLKKQFPELEDAFWADSETGDAEVAPVPSLNLQFRPAVPPAETDKILGLVRSRAKTELPGLQFEVILAAPAENDLVQ